MKTWEEFLEENKDLCQKIGEATARQVYEKSATQYDQSMEKLKQVKKLLVSYDKDIPTIDIDAIKKGSTHNYIDKINSIISIVTGQVALKESNISPVIYTTPAGASLFLLSSDFDSSTRQFMGPIALRGSIKNSIISVEPIPVYVCPDYVIPVETITDENNISYTKNYVYLCIDDKRLIKFCFTIDN